MLVKYIVSGVAALIIFSNVSAASAPVVVATDPVPVKSETINEKITRYAGEYNVSAVVMSNVIRCESQFNPRAVGDNGTSFGLSQIHLPAHPGITQEQAFDIDFSIEFMAKNIKSNPHMWSCYRIIYG